MKYFIFRNATIERFFSGLEAEFSGYGDISQIGEADRYIWFYMAPLKYGHAAIGEEIKNYIKLLELTLSRIDSGKMFIVFTLENIYSVNTVTSQSKIGDAVRYYNSAVYELAEKYGNVKAVDFAGFLRKYPDSELLDWKYYFISQMGLNPRLASAFKEWLNANIRAIKLKRKKCLVLDLDNTLWGGVLGEDGIDGIKLGGDYPGNAFLMFQHQIEELGKQGVILAACSKNNIEDVRELWAAHPECPLKEANFSILKINWNNKADNIRQMAAELNIGLNSFVFFDDNPTERALVRQEIPEVEVPEFPEQPYELPVFLKETAEKYFAVYSLTKEDISKTEQYKTNALRNSVKSQFTNMEEYIRSLEIVLKIAKANEVTLPRVAQMTQKTNQFNLTTQRYADADIKSLMDAGALVYTLSVKDRFGDNGITGAAIVKIDEKSASFDSFLLSCRILGKDIEKAFLAFVLRKLKDMGIEKIHAAYLPTTKNKQVENFYDNNYFSCINTQSDGTKHYELNMADAEIEPSNNYKFE